MNIRFATPKDAPALLKVYAHYIHTPVTFECSLPSEEEFARRITNIAGFYPYLACEEGGALCGYAYAHRHMERAAYQWGAELSAYLAPPATAKGLGKKLYGILIAMSRLQGVATVYGGVTLPNAKSEALHASLGFRVLGTYSNAGYKAGRWHDVAWFEKQIAPYAAKPEPVVSITAVPAEHLEKIIASAMGM